MVSPSDGPTGGPFPLSASPRLLRVIASLKDFEEESPCEVKG